MNGELDSTGLAKGSTREQIKGTRRQRRVFRCKGKYAKASKFHGGIKKLMAGVTMLFQPRLFFFKFLASP
jgi:hypothetical protein